MKIIIFGCCGYIGSETTEYFLKLGHTVVGVDNLLYKNIEPLGILATYPNFYFVNGDLGNVALLDQISDDVDVVINLAGVVSGELTERFPELSRDINIVQTQDNINFYKNKPIIYFFASTCSNYGISESLASEDSLLSPLTAYAHHKVGIEDYIKGLTHKAKFCPIILRFATAFGPALRTRTDLLVNDIVRSATLGNVINIFNGDAWRPYCFVGDFPKVFEAFLTSDKDYSYKVFNVGSDKNNITKNDLVDLVTKKLGKNIKVFEDGFKDTRDYRVSFSKLEKEFDIEFVGLEQGIQMLYKRFQKDPAECKNWL